ncbi:hypothetical protein ACFUYE_09425 [Micromonospora humida]|uniref:hypothetical protein n=1 Tax=Micromonospora humida TaxID=2809018 RepID=UPI003673139C
MTNRPTVVAVHGIWNLKADQASVQASQSLAERWGAALAGGYRAAGLTVPVPPVAAVYYADLLTDRAQGPLDDLTLLTRDEQRMAWAWMRELGVPDELAQGSLTLPLRQALSWLAQKRGLTSDTLGRIMTAVLREVYRYLTRPALRRHIRSLIIAAVEQHRPTALVAHSLGSVVAYEALHERPDLMVDTFVTCGSPLGLPGTVFEALDPPPHDGRGARPPGIRQWINVADVGDLVAVPVDFGGRFPVDRHDTVHVGFADFHTFNGYLATSAVAAAIESTR